MPMFKYRILTGHHINTDDKVYGPGHENGDVFTTHQNLMIVAHNRPGLQPRFELLGEPVVELTKEERVKALQAKADAVLAELAELTGASETVPADQVTQSSEPKAQGDGLDTMTTAQLREFARDSNVDILGLNRKDEIIAAIRQAIASS